MIFNKTDISTHGEQQTFTYTELFAVLVETVLLNKGIGSNSWAKNGKRRECVKKNLYKLMVSQS
jgi:hypothetical protein